MKKIGMKEFAEILSADPALSNRVRACSEAEAPRLLKQIAGELGYELDQPAMEALPDDDLSEVAGGRNPFADPNGGELNPYSWFVRIMRMILGRDGDENELGPEGSGIGPRRPM